MPANSWIIDCIAHWSCVVCESDIGVDWSDAGLHCWRCGGKRKLQRCHIVAKQFGGGDDATNIVPLCAECHDEAPDVTDPNEMWRWIKETKPMFYGTLKIERAMKVCVDRGVDLSLFDRDKFNQAMNAGVGLHLMQNGSGCRIKASSVAWAIQRACNKECTHGR